MKVTFPPEMRTAAREHALNNFGTEMSVKRYLDVLREVT